MGGALLINNFRGKLGLLNKGKGLIKFVYVNTIIIIRFIYWFHFVLTRASDASSESILQFPLKWNRCTIFWSVQQLTIHRFEVIASFHAHCTSTSNFPPDLKFFIKLLHLQLETFSNDYHHFLISLHQRMTKYFRCH